jgi:hypothetical protein
MLRRISMTAAWTAAAAAVMAATAATPVDTNTPTSHSSGDPSSTLTADVVVYGQTICGVTAAVAAGRMNASVVLVSERGDSHLGGMTTGGLSAMDLNMPTGGLWAEFMARTNIPQHPFPSFQARDASVTIAAMLAEVSDRVTVVLNTSGIVSVGKTPAAAAAAGGFRASPPFTLTSITTASGLTVSGTYFIDCSYEGDLLRYSGTAFAVGREAASEYNESLAGAEGPPWAAGRFPASVSPFTDDSNTTLLPTVSLAPDETPGQADSRVQAYNHRLCVTNMSADAVPVDPPQGYTPAAVELLRRWWVAQGPAGANLTLSDIFLIRDIVGGQGKVDINDGNMDFGTDLPFLQQGYPLAANWSARVAISAQHEWWIRALWHFLQTDASGAVPERVRTMMAGYGLCADEFNATAHYPPQLYIRESIRLRGQRVLSMADVDGTAVRHDPRSVGLSRWLVDIHVVQRVAAEDPVGSGAWYVVNAGDRNTAHTTWQLTEIPYDALIPSADDPGGATNLLVPVCASFTHVGFATYRLEAQYGVFGQSAAVAAVLALRQAGGSVPVQEVDVPALQKELLAQGQILNATAPPATPAITLQPCSGGGDGGAAAAVGANPKQVWAYSPSDSTLRLAGGTFDPAAVHVSARAREELAARGTASASAWSSLSPAARMLWRGPTTRGALSTVCASVLDYAVKPGGAIWAATCHTDDPDPAHQNQEFSLQAAPTGDGVYYVVEKMSGLCVGVDWATNQLVLASECAGGNSTVWQVNSTGGGGPWELTGAGAGLCATAPGW